MIRPTRTIAGTPRLFCRACSKWHPVASFYRRQSGRPDSHCKKCRGKQMRAYDQSHREERLAYWRAAGKHRRVYGEPRVRDRRRVAA